MAYKLQHSLGLLTNDTFSVHLASYYDKPIVCVSSILWPSCFYPYWSYKDKYVILDSHRNGNKPSFSAEEKPKTINLIKPEEVAQAAIEKFGLDGRPWYRTVHMGAKYRSSPIHDFVPNNVIQVPNGDKVVLQIRFDLDPNEQGLAGQLRMNKAVVITDRPISLELLKAFARHIQSLVYIIKGNDDPKFIKNVDELGIKVVLVSELPAEEVNKKKLAYYLYGRINPIELMSKEEIDKILAVPNLLYTSCKIIHSNKKHFASIPAMKLGIEFNEAKRYQPIINCKEFWDEADFFHIIEKTN